jgi:hypothetical protein
MKTLFSLAIALILVGVGCRNKPEVIKGEPFEPAHFDNNLHAWVLDVHDTAYIDLDGDHSFYGGTSYCIPDIPQIQHLHTIIDSLKKVIDSLRNRVFYPDRIGIGGKIIIKKRIAGSEIYQIPLASDDTIDPNMPH